MSFFRYPGGKSKLRDTIAGKLNEYAKNHDLEYREPFYGGGSIGLKFLADNSGWQKFWLNDKDVGVACLWTSVIRYHEEFKQKIMDFKPSVKHFDEFKEELLANNPMPKQRSKVVEYGFKKLAIHQISYSGLGTKSGGPLGGRDQKSKYPIDCRWSPEYICGKVDKLHGLFAGMVVREEACTNLDFAELIKDNRHPALIYLDPPYYDKGVDLYQHSFTEEDHKRLALALKETDHDWVLSYDECDEIRHLYNGWANVDTIDGVKYSITATKDKETKERKSTAKPELLITPLSNRKKSTKGILNVRELSKTNGSGLHVSG